MRAWARDNGYEVADRGRLPVEITDAYRAANKTPAKKAATAKAPAKKAAPRKTAAKAVPQKRAVAAAPVEVEQPPARAGVGKEAPVQESAAAKTPRPKPSLVSDDRRLVALGEEIKALTARVEALEKAGGGSRTSSKATRFRRRS